MCPFFFRSSFKKPFSNLNSQTALGVCKLIHKISDGALLTGDNSSIQPCSLTSVVQPQACVLQIPRRIALDATQTFFCKSQCSSCQLEYWKLVTSCFTKTALTDPWWPLPEQEPGSPKKKREASNQTSQPYMRILGDHYH